MKIIIDQLEYEKMLFWAQIAEGEVGGWGLADIVDNDVLITDVMLNKQEVSAAHVDHDENGINDMIARVGNEAPRIRLQWHSHGTMSAFFSSTDTDNIDNLITSGMEWLASIVIAKEGKYKARIDVGAPLRLYSEDVDIETTAIEPEENKEWRKEFDDNVTEKTYIAHIPAPRKGGRKKEPVGSYYGGSVGINTQPRLCHGCDKPLSGVGTYINVPYKGQGFVCEPCHTAIMSGEELYDPSDADVQYDANDIDEALAEELMHYYPYCSQCQAPIQDNEHYGIAIVKSERVLMCETHMPIENVAKDIVQGKIVDLSKENKAQRRKPKRRKVSNKKGKKRRK